MTDPERKQTIVAACERVGWRLKVSDWGVFADRQSGEWCVSGGPETCALGACLVGRPIGWLTSEGHRYPNYYVSLTEVLGGVDTAWFESFCHGFDGWQARRPDDEPELAAFEMGQQVRALWRANVMGAGR
jgi:hypothetical protein